LRAAHLEDDDRFIERRGAQRQLAKLARVSQALQIDGNDRADLVVQQVFDEVGAIEIRLVAGGYQFGNANPTVSRAR
jgi:hypothetical protein